MPDNEVAQPEQESTTGSEAVVPPETAASEDAPPSADDAPETAAGAELPPPLIPPPEVDGATVFKQRAQLAEDRLAQVFEAYRKFKAEAEGIRERAARNIERRFEQRRERLVLKFIDILDNLDRALNASENSGANDALVQGLILVRSQLLQTLQGEGLERIHVLGLPFDPSAAEGVETKVVEDPSYHHVVIKELQRGYRLNNRVVRPARVIVGSCASITDETPVADAPLEDAPAEKATTDSDEAGAADEPREVVASASEEPVPANEEHTFDALPDDELTATSARQENLPGEAPSEVAAEHEEQPPAETTTPS
ncbi:MAG: nucleotide exchange factor GrpE [Vicinamibacteria bacterium]|nr:nucleotide exchange factor GrpE [Vicinamibacteria bacterium]